MSSPLYFFLLNFSCISLLLIPPLLFFFKCWFSPLMVFSITVFPLYWFSSPHIILFTGFPLLVFTLLFFFFHGFPLHWFPLSGFPLYKFFPFPSFPLKSIHIYWFSPLLIFSLCWLLSVLVLPFFGCPLYRHSHRLLSIFLVFHNSGFPFYFFSLHCFSFSFLVFPFTYFPSFTGVPLYRGPLCLFSKNRPFCQFFLVVAISECCPLSI